MSAGRRDDPPLTPELLETMKAMQKQLDDLKKEKEESSHRLRRGHVHTLEDGVDDPEQGAIRVIPGEDHRRDQEHHHRHALNFEDVHRPKTTFNSTA